MIGLDYECMKDVLIYLQKHLEFDGDVLKPISWKTIYADDNLREYYTEEQLKYTLKVLKEIRFVQTSKYNYNPNTRNILAFDIDDITIDGHNFLINATNDKIWNATKTTIKTFGKVALPEFLKLLAKKAIELFG